MLNQGGLECWNRSVDFSTCCNFPFVQVKKQTLNILTCDLFFLLGKFKAPLQGIDIPVTPKSLQTHQSWEQQGKFTVTAIHWLTKKPQNRNQTPGTQIPNKDVSILIKWNWNRDNHGGQEGTITSHCHFLQKENVVEQTQREFQVWSLWKVTR